MKKILLAGASGYLGQYKMNPIHGEDLAEVCVNAIDTEEKTIEVGGPGVW